MKIKHYIILISITVFNIKVYSQNFKFNPLTIATFYLNNNNDSGWTFEEDNYYRYDNNSRMTYQAQRKWGRDTSMVWEQSFDEKGRKSSYYVKQKFNNNWYLVAGQRYKNVVYDTIGNDVVEIITIESLNANNWIPSLRSSTLLNSEKKVSFILHEQFNNNAWTTISKFEYHYDSTTQKLKEITIKESDALIKTSRFYNISGKENLDPNKLENYEYEQYLNNRWNKIQKLITTKQLSNQLLKTYFKWEDNDWKNDNRISITFNNDTLIILETREDYDTSWKLNFEEKHVYQMQNGKIKDEIIQQIHYNPNGNSTSVLKYVYDTSPFVGNPKVEITSSSIDLYPNPAKETIHFSLPIHHVEVFDYSMKIIQKFDNIHGIQKIDLNQIKPGIYWFKIIDFNNQILIKKILIE